MNSDFLIFGPIVTFAFIFGFTVICILQSSGFYSKKKSFNQFYGQLTDHQKELVSRISEEPVLTPYDKPDEYRLYPERRRYGTVDDFIYWLDGELAKYDPPKVEPKQVDAETEEIVEIYHMGRGLYAKVDGEFVPFLAYHSRHIKKPLATYRYGGRYIDAIK